MKAFIKAHEIRFLANHHQAKLPRNPQDLAKVLDDLLRAVVSLREVRIVRIASFGIFMEG